MARNIKITRITTTHFGYEIADLELEEQLGFDTVYRKGGRLSQSGGFLTIETSAGISGTAHGGIDARTAQYLLGRNPLDREIIWHDLKRSRRGQDGTPPGSVDVALWDFAGKLYDAPIYELLGGGWRKKLPAYASTYHGDENGGLTTPDDFAQFALRCKEQYGYPAFKIHGWVNGPIDREVAAVLAIRATVGDDMDLLLDPAGCFPTFEDVLKVGRACDEARYMWYEDPFRGGGFSRFAHAKLRELIKTPMLMGEHVRGLEAKADTITAGATDFVRANSSADGGITGVMKIAAYGRGARAGRGVARRQSGAPPHHGDFAQCQLLRVGLGASFGQRYQAGGSMARGAGSTSWIQWMKMAAWKCQKGRGWAWRWTGIGSRITRPGKWFTSSFYIAVAY